MNNTMSVYHTTLSEKLFTKDIEEKPTRDGYGDGVVEAGKLDPNVVVLCCDLKDSTRSAWFEKEFPKRFIEVGIAEQNMAGLATGLSFAGKVPFMSSYAVFSPGRNWDQIRVSVCYSQANVKIMGAHAGISVGPDGATHQALEDVAIMRVLPHMTVIVPGDYWDCKKAVMEAAKLKGPVYIRFAREKTPVFTTEKTPFSIGRAEVLRQGEDVAIIACGTMVHEALLASKELEKEHINAMVINNHTIKPLDEKTILMAAKTCKRIVTVEEHQAIGGLGSAIAEYVSNAHPVPVHIIGIQDRFGESGEPNELLTKYGLRSANIIDAVKKLLR